MTRKVALVAVGVNRTKVLTDLRGAAAGAEVLAQWFRAQERFGVEVTVEVLVDESADGSTRPVRVRDVQDSVARLVDDGSYDLLALYLAGHGIVKSGTDEQVLLSDVHLYPQEAVSVVATAQAARFCGVPHFVIISDACRNAVDPFSQLGLIAGVPVVRRRGVVGVKPTQVDLFYATEPSQTAKEFYGEGFFTKILCRALDQAPSQICQAWKEYAPNRVIDGWLLGEYLRDHVPREAASATPAFDQTPDAIVLSRAPLFLGYAPPAELGPVYRSVDDSSEPNDIGASYGSGSFVISGGSISGSILGSDISILGPVAQPSPDFEPGSSDLVDRTTSDEDGGDLPTAPSTEPGPGSGPIPLVINTEHSYRVVGFAMDDADPFIDSHHLERARHPDERVAFPVEEVWEGEGTPVLGPYTEQIGGLDHLVVHALGDAIPFADKHTALHRVVWRVGNPESAGSIGRENAALDAAGLRARVESYLARLAAEVGEQDPRLRDRGVVIVGAEVSRVFIGEADPLVGPDQFDGVRAGDRAGPYAVLPRDAFRPSAHTVMVELNGVTAAPLPAIPGHTVIAFVTDGMVQDVIIEKSESTDGDNGRMRVTLLQWRRAVMASLAAAGKLHLVGQLRFTDVYSAVTYAGQVDLTLALYAAYGCALAGNDANLSALLRCIGDRNTTLPLSGGVAMFDLAVLSRRHPTRRLALAPFCPSISLGWSFLASLIAPSEMPAALAYAAPLRLNAEWTTFRSADIAPLLDALNFREVS